jgi:uncharacterized repeat protein (TIGR03803 family)
MTTVTNGSIFEVSSSQTSSSFIVDGGGILVVLGSGVLTMASNGTLVNSGGVDIDPGGAITVDAGGTATDDGMFVVGGTFTEDGVATVAAGGYLTVAAGGTLTISGTLTVASGGAGIVDADGMAQVLSGGSVSGLTLSAGSSLDLSAGATISGAINFAGGALVIDGTAMPGGTLDNFSPGDTIYLANISFDSAGTANLAAGNQLEITENGSTYDLQFDPTLNFTGDSFVLTGDAAGGTQITEVNNSTNNSAASLLTLASFNGTDGLVPDGGLIVDATGNLYGVTKAGGPTGYDGTVYEIENTATGYSSTPITLASFDVPDGAFPGGGLIADAAGNLYGTSQYGGTDDDGGMVFEIAKTASGYSSTPIVLASFPGIRGGTGGGAISASSPYGGLIADAADNLYGTTEGGRYFNPTVFEIAKTATGYSSTPITLAFDVGGPLLIDAAGNLYGTGGGGFYGDGTVVEIEKTATGYNSTPVTLATFDGSDGASLTGGLVADTAGDLFGTTATGGAYGNGTVFEIAKTASGYSSTPITLASFDYTDGDGPAGSLIMDAAGDLFGTTSYGGAYGNGTVYEIAHTGPGRYSSTPITLVSFEGTYNSSDGEDNVVGPNAGLIADTAGNLYGTTQAGGANGDGTVFEITDSGFVPFATTNPIVVNVQNISVPEDEAIAGASLVAGISNPNGDSITAYSFIDQGGDGGHFLLNGVAQPDNQAISVPLNALGSIEYVGGTMLGSETLEVAVYDRTTNSYSNDSQLTATTTVESASDFTGNGVSDVLWEYEDQVNPLDPDDDQVAIWLMNGTTPTATSIIQQVPPNWQAITTGDFTGDGKADILWEYADNMNPLDPVNGYVGIWLMNGTTPVSEQVIQQVPFDWKPIATGDFSGNGTDDIVWEYEDNANPSDPNNGDVAIWMMNNGMPSSEQIIQQVPGSWHIITTGDFSGNGASDLLWQYENSANPSDPNNGEVAIWMMNGTTPVSEQIIGQPPASWHPVATGDFSGNGMDDIVWEYDNSTNPLDPNNGDVAIWMMDGATPVSEQVIQQVPTSWQVVTTGDFFGNGKDDIVRQNTNNGSAAIWQMNGPTPTAETVFATPPASWHVIPG